MALISIVLIDPSLTKSPISEFKAMLGVYILGAAGT